MITERGRGQRARRTNHVRLGKPVRTAARRRALAARRAANRRRAPAAPRTPGEEWQHGQSEHREVERSRVRGRRVEG